MPISFLLAQSAPIGCAPDELEELHHLVIPPYRDNCTVATCQTLVGPNLNFEPTGSTRGWDEFITSCGYLWPSREEDGKCNGIDCCIQALSKIGGIFNFQFPMRFVSLGTIIPSNSFATLTTSVFPLVIFLPASRKFPEPSFNIAALAMTISVSEMAILQVFGRTSFLLSPVTLLSVATTIESCLRMKTPALPSRGERQAVKRVATLAKNNTCALGIRGYPLVI